MMKIFCQKRLITIALAILSFSASGIAAEPITEKFDNFATYPSITLPDDWYFYGSTTLEKGTDSGTYKSKPSISFSVANSSAYLITPVLEGEFNFYLRNLTKSYQATVTAYACTYEDGNFELGREIDYKKLSKSSSTPTFENVKFTSPTATRVALLISQGYFDDFTYTPGVLAQGGPSLTVSGYASGDTYNFGGVPVPAATEVSFTIINGGDQDLTISSVTVSGKYQITEGGESFTIAPNENGVVKVITPAEDTEGQLEIISNDADNSPFVINLKSEYKVPMPVMVVDASPIQFGPVKAIVSREVSVGNSGDKDLVVAIRSNSEKFVVNPSALTVKPDSLEIFTVSFQYDEKEFGEYNAEITLQPEEISGTTIAVSATVKDPSIWEEDFEGREMPPYWSTNGWTVTNSVYPGNGTYVAYAGLTEGVTLTTPRLSAKEGDKLTFEVGGGVDNVTPLYIEYSSDQNNWTELDPVEETGIYTFNAPEAGYYYLRFSGKYSYVDNFCGFSLALKEHDLSIISHNIPSNGHQYIEYTAKVKVQEMLGKNETAQACLIVDGDKKAESEIKEIEANGTVEFSLPFTPEESMDQAEAKILVSYGDSESIITAPVSLTISPAVVVSEEDTEFKLSANTTYPSLVFKYTPVAGWNTITFPFEPNTEIFQTIFGEDCKIFEMTGYDAADGMILFDNPTRYATGYPYAVKANPKEETTVSVVVKDARTSFTTPGSDAFSGVEFFGLFTPLNNSDAQQIYVINKGGYLLAAEDDETIGAYHGYITLPSSIPGIPVLNFKGEEISSIVESLGIQDKEDTIYDIWGRRCSKITQPGLYIINGKKVMVR